MNYAAAHRQVVNEIYHPVKINFPRRRYEILSLDDVLQLDLADLSLLGRSNDGHKYILVAINPFSKKIYTVPLKTKTAREVTDATKEILRRSNIRFKKIMSDKGTEFKNAIFKREISEANGIHHYFSNSIKKCAFAERAIGNNFPHCVILDIFTIIYI